MQAKGFRQKLLHEIKAVGLATLYFGCWLATSLIIKKLLLAEYHIEFSGDSYSHLLVVYCVIIWGSGFYWIDIWHFSGAEGSATGSDSCGRQKTATGRQCIATSRMT